MISIDSITNVKNIAATIYCEIFPNGLTISYYLTYGLPKQYSDSTTIQTLSRNEDSIRINIGLNNLTPNMNYHCKLIAYNKNGKTESADFSFTTVNDKIPAIFSNYFPLELNNVWVFNLSTQNVCYGDRDVGETKWVIVK